MKLQTIIPALAVCIGALQIWNATAATLTPWKGGGFGMFATIDGPGNRYLVVRAVTIDGRSFAVRVPFGQLGPTPEFSTMFASRLAAMPSEALARRLARAVVTADLVPTGDTYPRLSRRLELSPLARVITGPESLAEAEVVPTAGHDGSLAVERVSVEVFRIRFNSDRRVAFSQRLVGSEVRRGNARSRRPQ